MASCSTPTKGFLTRLLHNEAGNTLAIVAAAIFPLAGMIGGGVDMSRLYLAKTRVQQACDAGALAGRKAMASGSWNDDAKDTALEMFKANFAENAYGTGALNKDFSENSGTVTGTASVVVPMTIMRIFGQTSKTLQVSCTAEMRIPNTDVMFVLDTTGSMNCRAGDKSCSNNGGVEAYNAKMKGLRTAVRCFYEALAKKNTEADCGSTPNGGNGATVQLRFGFVPYSTNVNVGYLLPTSYFADEWTYQSRMANGTDWSDWQKDNKLSYSGKCTGKAPNNTAKKQYVEDQTSSWWGTSCNVYVRNSMTKWHYGPSEFDISDLKNGAFWNTSFTAPIGNDGSARTIHWDGCIEERQTVAKANYWPIPTDAKDLNIDLVPEQGDKTTLWGPALNDLIYVRRVESSWNQMDNSEVNSTKDYYNSVPYYCPTEAKKLQEWNSATDFDDYVDSLHPDGNTYHDIGLIWGARFISPTGIFASENAFTPKGGQIERHLIFMTDGATQTNNTDYNAYGFPAFDRRQTSSSKEPSTSDLNKQVNERFTAICSAVRNMNVTLWVVSFGGGIDEDTEDRLEACASKGRYYKADDSETLIANFKQIASEISQLRLTK